MVFHVQVNVAPLKELWYLSTAPIIRSGTTGLDMGSSFTEVYAHSTTEQETKLGHATLVQMRGINPRASYETTRTDTNYFRVISVCFFV